MGDEKEAMRWVWRVSALGIVLVGWLFIFWQNRFHVTAPVVIVCLGYFAIVAMVFNLWRTGAITVAVEDDEQDSTWSKSLGARGELEREKKTLLKAIKEAEFDREMGKLSSQDASEMIAIYRARAIEVIKELDRMDAGFKAGSVREQIQREVKARIEILDKTVGVSEKPAAVAKAAKAKKKAGKQASETADKAADKPAEVATAADVDGSTAKATEAANEAKAKADAAIEAATAAVSATQDPEVSREQALAAKQAAEAAVAEAEAALARAKEAARAVGADGDATSSRSSST